MVFSRNSWAKLYKIFFLITIFFISKTYPFRFFKKSLFRSSQDNFYEVEKGTFYRSKQLTPKRLSFFIKKFKIKTIINLRGENKNKSWWRREKKVAEKLKLNFYNIPMSARRLPHKKDLATLLNLYENAPRPILVHCHSGADRTGEAAALWILDQQKKRRKDALKQLRLKYGHLKFKRPSKRFFIKIWNGRKWALNQYNPKLYPKYYPI